MIRSDKCVAFPLQTDLYNLSGLELVEDFIAEETVYETKQTISKGEEMTHDIKSYP